jgi:catechol 2,3-dioxygenase-like lactoylglutathione lyase family enzyme
MRVQLALNVENLDEAITYYSKLFGVEVNKRKPGYANFAIDEPPLKLVLFEAPGASERLNHLGVETFEQVEVDRAIQRLDAAGIKDAEENESTCCFATQNKVWSHDPQGMRWEWYRILEDAEEFSNTGHDTRTSAKENTERPCCGTTDE